MCLSCTLIVIHALDIFFTGQLWLTYASASNSINIELMIFGLSVLFLVIPVLINLFQLHNELKTWVHTVETKMIIQSWLSEHVKVLYLIAILTGSAFSSIELCNSGLFGLSMFYMNLPKKQKQIFKNKRLYSIVLCENIPQLILQLIYCLIQGDSITFIVLSSMLLSLISIVLTLFENAFKNALFATDSLLFIKFTAQSKHMCSMKHKQFRKNVEYRRFELEHQIALILSVDVKSVELLKPIQTVNGATFTFYVACDIIEPSTAMDMIKQQIDPTKHTLNKVE